MGMPTSIGPTMWYVTLFQFLVLETRWGQVLLQKICSKVWETSFATSRNAYPRWSTTFYINWVLQKKSQQYPVYCHFQRVSLIVWIKLQLSGANASHLTFHRNNLSIVHVKSIQVNQFDASYELRSAKSHLPGKNHFLLCMWHRKACRLPFYPRINYFRQGSLSTNNLWLSLITNLSSNCRCQINGELQRRALHNVWFSHLLYLNCANTAGRKYKIFFWFLRGFGKWT